MSGQFQSPWESSKATTVEQRRHANKHFSTGTSNNDCPVQGLSVQREGFLNWKHCFSQCLLGRKTVENFTSLYSWINWHCHKVAFSFFHRLLHLPALEPFVHVVTLYYYATSSNYFLPEKGVSLYLRWGKFQSNYAKCSGDTEIKEPSL